MRPVKMLGLGMLACLATMALVGATSASADTFCLESGHHTDECPSNKRFSFGNIVGKSTSKALLLENKKIKEECDSELLALGSTVTNEGPDTGVEILVDTGDFNFTNCTGFCKESENEGPFWILAEALTLDAWVTPDSTSLPSALLTKCLFAVECLYKFTSDKVFTSISGDAITATDVALTGGGGLCPSSSLSFDGTWLITVDAPNGAPIYLAAKP